MSVTIQQIADLAGVSRGTVDRALNNRGRINPEVAKRIKEIADELGYIPKKIIKEKNYNHKIKIGVITQLTKSSFMLKVNEGIKDAKKELSYRNIEILLKECNSVDEREQLQAIDGLLKESITGLAIMPVNSDSIRQRLNYLIEERHIPVVTFNSDIVGVKRACFIGLDNKKSGLTAAGLMGMLTRGTGKILVITGYFSNSANSLRVDGFLEEVKVSFPSLEVIGVQSSFDNAAEVERIVLQTVETFPDLAGIFMVSGGQSGVWKAFKKLDLVKRPYVIIYDLTTENQDALRNGNVDFLIDQEGYIQGYRASTILAEIILKNMAPEKEYLYTDINILTRYNM